MIIFVWIEFIFLGDCSMLHISKMRYQVHEQKQIYNTFYQFPEKLNPVDSVTHDFQMHLFARSLHQVW